MHISRAVAGSIRHRRLRRHADRRGAMLVEFAITVPILFLLIFASVEFCRVNVIRHTADNAAYEAARRGVVPGATADAVRALATSVMQAVSADTVTVAVTPDVITNDTPEITVTVTVPLDANGWIAPAFFEGKTLVRTCTMSREKIDYTVPQG